MAKISNERKAMYYIGMGIMGVGAILFVSVFFEGAKAMNSPMMMEMDTSIMTRPIIGIIMMVVGGVVMNVGAKGAAGSGLLLDPNRAREDMKPFNEAKGGMINDVISNIDVVQNMTKPQTHQEREIIKVRCKNCSGLNDEDAQFCKSCGKQM